MIEKRKLYGLTLILGLSVSDLGHWSVLGALVLFYQQVQKRFGYIQCSGGRSFSCQALRIIYFNNKVFLYKFKDNNVD